MLVPNIKIHCERMFWFPGYFYKYGYDQNERKILEIFKYFESMVFFKDVFFSVIWDSSITKRRQ